MTKSLWVNNLTYVVLSTYIAGADIHKTRYRTDVLVFNKRYKSRTGHYHVYERGVPDIVLQHEKCMGHVWDIL